MMRNLLYLLAAGTIAIVMAALLPALAYTASASTAGKQPPDNAKEITATRADAKK